MRRERRALRTFGLQGVIAKGCARLAEAFALGDLVSDFCFHALDSMGGFRHLGGAGAGDGDGEEDAAIDAAMQEVPL